jgi:hypothetical protein
MNYESRDESVRSTGVCQVEERRVANLDRSPGQEIEQVADVLRSKTAAQMADVLLANDQLLTELLGP